ncbi:hypothetical protein AAFC00_001243 [Neodothiora populina]|uniref:Uncharacterized protein n=1 Tax=Neodothiora populina TaxID=2781224 RepID=A0ABR3PN83_9PEZI
MDGRGSESSVQLQDEQMTESDNGSDIDDNYGDKFETIEFKDDAEVFYVRIITGGSEEIKQITHLSLIIDSDTFFDDEDDTWSTMLRAYAPLSQRLTHLTIVVKGANLFTRSNYIKPLLYDMASFGYTEDFASECGGADVLEQDYKKDSRKIEQLLPNGEGNVTKYQRRAIGSDQVNLHVTGEKAIVTAIVNLQLPIPHVTIYGYMEYGLRSYLVQTLNPEWEQDEDCLIQLGYVADDFEDVQEAIHHEEECLIAGTHMVRISPVTEPDEMEHFNGPRLGRDNLIGWPLLTGRALRQVYGWRGETLRAWKGPPEN